MNVRFLKLQLMLGLVIGSVVLAMPAFADIYKYVDRHGRTHYTDNPPHVGYKLVMRSTSSSNPARGERRISRQGAKQTAHNKNRKLFSNMIQRVARKYRLSADLLHAVVSVESAYNPKALSRAGAVGLMQLMPATAERYGVKDIWDPADNLDGGARYLRDLLAQFDNDLKLGLAAYNAGENAVIRYGNRIPPYRETQDYVVKVIKRFKQRLLAPSQRNS